MCTLRGKSRSLTATWCSLTNASPPKRYQVRVQSHHEVTDTKSLTGVVGAGSREQEQRTKHRDDK
jgi:hypothetical protein